MMGDRAAGDVGTSHPEVGDSIRLPGTSSPIQDVSTVEGSQVPVREPVRIPEAPPQDVVSLGVRGDANPTLEDKLLRPPSATRNPTEVNIIKHKLCKTTQVI